MTLGKYTLGNASYIKQAINTGISYFDLGEKWNQF
jgi:hypothetical protein